MSTRQTSYYSYSHHKLDNLALNRPADGRRKPSEMSPVLDTEKCQQVTRSDLTTSLPARDSLENDSTAYFVFSTFISCQFVNIILHNQYFNSHHHQNLNRRTLSPQTPISGSKVSGNVSKFDNYYVSHWSPRTSPPLYQ